MAENHRERPLPLPDMADVSGQPAHGGGERRPSSADRRDGPRQGQDEYGSGGERRDERDRPGVRGGPLSAERRGAERRDGGERGFGGESGGSRRGSPSAGPSGGVGRAVERWGQGGTSIPRPGIGDGASVPETSPLGPKPPQLQVPATPDGTMTPRTAARAAQIL